MKNNKSPTILEHCSKLQIIFYSKAASKINKGIKNDKIKVKSFENTNNNLPKPQLRKKEIDLLELKK